LESPVACACFAIGAAALQSVELSAARRQLCGAAKAQPAGLFERLTGGCGGPPLGRGRELDGGAWWSRVAIRQSPAAGDEVAKPAPPAQSISIPARPSLLRNRKVSRDEAQSEEKRAVRPE